MCRMLHVMTDTSCGEEALHPRGARVSVCCCNLSGREDVSHVEGESEGCLCFCIMHAHGDWMWFCLCQEKSCVCVCACTVSLK